MEADAAKDVDQTDPSIAGGKQARGFDKCSILAQNTLPKALNNPDNYRVFAETSYLSGTRWGAPAPSSGSGSGSGSGKRSLSAVEFDAELNGTWNEHNS